MIENKALIFTAIPDGMPVAGQHLTVKDIGFDESATPEENGFITKSLYASYDASQRGRMRDKSIPSYNTAYTLGQPITAVALLARVLQSDNAEIAAGEIVRITWAPVQEYTSFPGTAAARAEVIHPAEGIPLPTYLGALGVSGLTAYGSLLEIGRPVAGQVILVSAAAGAVGQIVGQIALQKGLHVIGSVGDDRKLDFIVNQLKFTSGFNYKKENMDDALKRLAPDGLDIYYDNVGGELLDAALNNMKQFGRIVACGTVSTYNTANDKKPHGITQYAQINRRSLTYQGFMVFNENIQKWKAQRDQDIISGMRDESFQSVHHVTHGIDNAVEGLLGLLRGDNLGKAVLEISTAGGIS